MRSDAVRLFQTLPHACGYFPERTAQNLVLDPASPHLPGLYDLGLQRGYRRAGGHVYQPQCVRCHACIPCRIAVQQFQPSRSQRRCARRNADVQVAITHAGLNDERFALYQRYLSSRHRDGGMDDAKPEDFSRFLYTDWSPTRFIELRLHGQLIAVAVTDFSPSGLSAVYTFFDPDQHERGLGNFAILSQIGIARAQQLPHLYLGFWIERHPKMDYKRHFHPLEVRRGGAWNTLGTKDEAVDPPTST